MAAHAGAAGRLSVGLEQVREAYAARAAEYVALCTGAWQDDADDTALVLRHLTGLSGPVLDVGCGPGHWTARLHAHGADVTGVDPVPAFVEHARATVPGPRFRLGALTALDEDDGAVAGALAWYSTVHLPPDELAPALAELHRVLAEGAPLVVGFFARDDDADGHDAVPFAHAVTTAWAWPVDLLAARLQEAGFAEVKRRLHRLPDRPDRRYGALVVRAA